MRSRVRSAASSHPDDAPTLPQATLEEATRRLRHDAHRTRPRLRKSPTTVEADNEWNRTRKLELLEQFDYDLRRLMLEGSAEELAAWNYFDPAIVEHESRVVAYQEQVCEAVS